MSEDRLMFLTFLLFPAFGIPVGIDSVRKMKLPNDLIFLDGDKILIYDGRSFAFNEIKDVTYKHASTRYGAKSFGRITFILNNGETLKVYPVAEVEDAGKRISKLIYSQNNK